MTGSGTPIPRRIGVAPSDADAVAALAAATGLRTVTATVLHRRGVADEREARAFLAPDLDATWRDPESLPGMSACADAVADAIRAGRRIVVFGDFDVDGLTAAALTARGLAAMGARVTPFVPRRFAEGYGLSEAAVGRALELQPELVITVDCGISGAHEVALLRERGVDVVVTDHHEPGEGVPDGVPVCDPKLSDSGFDGLAGAGVALKLVAAVGSRSGFPEVWRDLTDLAAIGTVGDVVPLVDENRALVADGLARIRAGARAGVAALCEVAGVDPTGILAERIAFGLAPRINAAGRIADPVEALELLMTDDPGVAAGLARSLDSYNRARQAEEARLFEQADEQARALAVDGRRALVLAGEGWHEGVKGIVAARIASRYGVPAFLFCIEDGEARGSGRSVGTVDLYAALTACAHLVTRFGGHAAAAGVALQADGLPAFAECLESALAGLPDDAFAAQLAADAVVRLDEADRELAAELALLEPFGAGNPRPVLLATGVFMNARKRVGATGDHLRFEAYDGVVTRPAIAFRVPDVEDVAACDAAVDLAFCVETDTWQGRERVQLAVRRIVAHAAGEAGAAELVEELFADAERVLARGEYDGVADAEAFHTKVAGVTFEGRQDLLGALEPGTPLRLVREPDNSHDPAAVAVREPGGARIGYLNRRLAAALAPELDRGAAWDVVVSEVTGTERDSRGVNIELRRVRGDEEAASTVPNAEERERLSALPADELTGALTRAWIGERAPHAAQAEALARLEAGASVLAVMATGRGKSFIFQVHAARRALREGAASVFVYPLRALIADQAFHLTEVLAAVGLRACVLTGETAPGARDAGFDAVAAGEADVVLTTPEFLEHHAARFAAAGRIGFVVVDEAHHVGTARAGHRPAYARLAQTLAALGSPQVCAVTATAPDEVAATIRSTLGIDVLVTDDTRRDNLVVRDRRGLADKPAYLASIAAAGDKTIVYVNSREQSVRIAQRLREISPRLASSVAYYNGGLTRAARHAVERAFRDGRLSVVVATSAFGEGVSIPDIRHVALFHLPFGRVEFNQMCGRAGRDGASAEVHLLFGERDGRLNEMILGSSAPDVDDLRALYAAIRSRAADGGWAEATNAELAEDVRAMRPRTTMNDRGVSAGIGVFRELGLVAGEGTGAYRRLSVLPVEGKLDITASVRYAEGLREREEFDGFREWVLGEAPDRVREAFDRPILPHVVAE